MGMPRVAPSQLNNKPSNAADATRSLSMQLMQQVNKKPFLNKKPFNAGDALICITPQSKHWQDRARMPRQESWWTSSPQLGQDLAYSPSDPSTAHVLWSHP